MQSLKFWNIELVPYFSINRIFTIFLSPFAVGSKNNQSIQLLLQWVLNQKYKVRYIAITLVMENIKISVQHFRYKYYLLSINFLQQYLILKEKMINQTLFYQPITTQNLTGIYANYMVLQQKLLQNAVYHNSINLNPIISYAVSMDFKKFQSQYLVQEMKKQLFDTPVTLKSLPQNPIYEVSQKNSEKNIQNLNSIVLENDKQQTAEPVQILEKSEKQDHKSKTLTSDQSSDKNQFDNCSIKENKNSHKNLKKLIKPDTAKELPKIDLIEFAFIRKEAFKRQQIEKKKNSLLARQVENWNDVQKTRRNQKLQLRRIKY